MDKETEKKAQAMWEQRFDKFLKSLTDEKILQLKERLKI